MAMAFLLLKQAFGKFAYKIILQGVWANLVFKHASGHRPCPIACSAFKSLLIITNLSIGYQNTLISVTTLSF